MGVGPSTKETTLHHFRDPLIEIVRKDPELDLIGVVIVGSPDDNDSKFFVSSRLGLLAEAFDIDGVLIHCEGFGNQHVDFAAHMEEFGQRDIPAVGLTFTGNGLVVSNQYMEGNVIDLEKTDQGMETAVVSQNSTVAVDVVRALRLLKNRLKAKKAGAR
ncbi:MAG TPA: glycine/sarcosine/betaine reductase component B subunit [Selenomonadales bacterium]|nr:glycine/sarcosine/betaine reductase component B subunit [Selenomonadales bacterium]